MPRFFYSPMQEVAPSAVRIAEAIDTMICTINLVVSFLLITIQNFSVWCWIILGAAPRLMTAP